MRLQPTDQRRGVILMVVLALLTLFALVGLTFVLYADAEATAARVARESESLQRADMDPEQALALFLGQLIYDVPDTTMTGVNSGLRGHSLARNMYGYNYTTNNNVTPYNGVGRLHASSPLPYVASIPAQFNYNSTGVVDDYALVNYTWFSTDTFFMNPATNFAFVRDPERYGLRASVTATQANPYVGGNPPYTYPDLNNFFLAAVNSQGQVITPSFHRKWLFNPSNNFNDMTNLNWTNPQGKYLTLRPRPADHAGFPAPDDAWGDVKNLVGAPGGNDSIWIDIGAPVMTAPDGTKYKALFAPLIMDLDNRINVAAGGNLSNLGSNSYASRSNQGWFSSELNLSQVLNYSSGSPATTTEWQNLFQGYGTYYGKYGAGIPPLPPLPMAPLQLPIGPPTVTGATGTSSGTYAHVYSQVDLDGRNEMAGNIPTTSILLPGTNAAAPATNCFPTFPQGYGSGSSKELLNHPAAYSVYKSPLYNYNSSVPNTNLVFRASDMEGLLRPNSLGQTAVDTGSSALISNLLRLCPNNLCPSTLALDPTGTISYQRRNWITTVSSDLARPGLSPWIFNCSNPTFNANPSYYSTYGVNTATPSLPPVGMSPAGTPNPYIPFPSIAQLTAAASLSPPLPASEFLNGQAADASILLGSAVGRIDLNRSLPPYPHMSSGSTSMLVAAANTRYDYAAWNGAVTVPSAAQYGLMQPGVQTQFNLARLAREQFAIDIYTRLLAVTGVSPPVNPAVPTAAELAPRRWLAQLAANIVDYIDADEISTAFCFYNPANTLSYGLPTAGTYNYTLTPTVNTYPPSSAGPPPGNGQVPTYWVFGTELPRLVISEALGEYTLPTNGQSPPTLKATPPGSTIPVNIWVELYNPMPLLASPAYTVGPTGVQNTANGSTLQLLDGLAEPLYMPVAGTANAYNTYQLVIANNDLSNTTLNPYGLWYDYNTATLNSNVLGMPQQIRVSNTSTTPPTSAICQFGELMTNGGMANTISNPPPNPAAYSLTAGLPGQSYMLVGPATSNDVNSDINATNVTAAKGSPTTTPWLQSTNMQYPVAYTPPNTFTNNSTPIVDNMNGVSVLLRRLANPHLPPNPFVAAVPPGISAPTLANPALPPNPYITVDYLHGVPLNGYGSDGTNLLSISNPTNKFSPSIPTTGISNVPNPSSGAWFMPNPPSSYGKLQPYAGDPTQCALQTFAPNGTTSRNTLGAPNQPVASPFTWLTHLDRKLISPVELLHVSGFHPHELTQRFVLGPTALATNLIQQPYGYPTQYQTANVVAGSYYFQHYVPWFDQSRRLYRLFEFLDTHDGMSGISPTNGRVPGKININTLWDVPMTYPGTSATPTSYYPEIYQALYDATGTFSNSNYSTAATTAAAANLLFQTLLYKRTPGLFTGNFPIVSPNTTTPTLSASDQPFVGMAAGVAPTTGDTQYLPNNLGNTMGINHTLFTDNQLFDSAASPTTNRALQILNSTPTNPQAAHPYLQMELLNKIYNRLTTRSNVYAVFLTVGFFQVTNPAASPPTLGAEIGLSEGRNVRHRMFAILDRTNLQAGSAVWTIPAPNGPPPPPPGQPLLAPANVLQITGPTTANPTGNQTITVPLNLTLTSPNGGTGPTISVGTQLVFEPGTANEETVTVLAVTLPNTATPPNPLPTITANFTRPHPPIPPVTAKPAPSSYNYTVTAIPPPASYSYTVAIRGNPGPWTQPYDPRKDPGVVLYYNIID